MGLNHRCDGSPDIAAWVARHRLSLDGIQLICTCQSWPKTRLIGQSTDHMPGYNFGMSERLPDLAAMFREVSLRCFKFSALTTTSSPHLSSAHIGFTPTHNAQNCSTLPSRLDEVKCPTHSSCCQIGLFPCLQLPDRSRQPAGSKRTRPSRNNLISSNDTW